MADNPRPFGVVVGELYAGVGDSADPGRNPDLVGLEGTVTFSATIDRDIITTPGFEKIIIPQDIVADVEDGVLMWGGVEGVPLVANLDDSGTSLGWQWKVSFQCTMPTTGKDVTIRGYNLNVGIYDSADPDTLTQLTTDAPVVDPSGNVQITKGPKGDTGAGVVFLAVGAPIPVGTPVPSLIVRYTS